MAATRPMLTATASLLNNNLSCSAWGWVAVVHNATNAGTAKILLHSMSTNTSKDGPDAAQVTSVRTLTFPWGTVLCVLSGTGTKIYSEDCTTVLFFRQVGEASSPESVRNHMGACVVAALNQIAIGTSKGTVVLVAAPTADQMVSLGEAVPEDVGATEVADLCFNDVANFLFTAHTDGQLRVWAPSADGSYANSHVIPAQGAQAPVTTAPLGARVVVGYGPGMVRLYNAMTFGLEVEIAAHARWLTALAVKEDLGLVATVGEDTVLNVWQVDPGSGQVALQHTSAVTDKLLTGVGFFGTSLLVVAYDSAELYQVML